MTSYVIQLVSGKYVRMEQVSETQVFVYQMDNIKDADFISDKKSAWTLFKALANGKDDKWAYIRNSEPLAIYEVTLTSKSVYGG